MSHGKQEEKRMEMILQMLLLVLGFLMLVKGADWFVDGASGIAERFGIPQLVVGLTIVAMGTSMPEAAVSINSALKGNAGITIGNIVGSNILNILIILGITAVITTVAVQKSTIWIEIPYMLVITVLLLVLGKSGNQITFSEGVILWVVFLLYLGYLFYCAKKNKEEVIAEEAKPMWKLLLATVLGLLLVVWGSDVTVDAATAISERVIGLTVVALGTSLPELFTSVSAARKGKADIAIGNIVGSNIFNILFVVGTSALIVPVEFLTGFGIDTVIALGAGLLLWVCTWRKRALTRPAGIVMLTAYLAYFIYLM